MKILCIDTSSPLCGVSVLEDNNLIKKLELNNGLTHSETLMPLIKNILEECELTLNDINLLVCDIGPGSFTGIRIGIATVKAFSDSLGIPCIGVSSLEVLAYNIKENGLICSSINCKNDNCYFALYELNDGIYKVVQEPKSDTVKNVLDFLNTKHFGQVIHFVGNGLPDKSTNNYLSVENIGIIGFKKYLSNNKQGEEILPLYLKKPQAQIQLEEKLKA